MKKILFVTFSLMLTASVFSKQSWPVQSWPKHSWSQNLVELNNSGGTPTSDDGWILVGEMLLSTSYRQVSNTVTANLYIREVANKIIYRIEYNGKFYAVGKGYNKVDNDTYYYVTIGKVTYFFNVQ